MYVYVHLPGGHLAGQPLFIQLYFTAISRNSSSSKRTYLFPLKFLRCNPFHIFLKKVSFALNHLLQFGNRQATMLARNIYRSSSTARAGPSLVSHMAGYRTSSPAWGASVTAAEQPSTSRSTVDHQQLPFADIQRHSGWRVDGKESLTRENFYSVLANKLSYISVPEFLSADECSRLVNVIETHEIVCMK